MGNSHFAVSSHNATTIYNVELKKEDLTYHALCDLIALQTRLRQSTWTVECEIQTSWHGVNEGNFTLVMRNAKGRGTKGDPIRLRLKSVKAPSSSDDVHFWISDDDRGDTRFSLPREGVTLEALLAECTYRYGPGGKLRWAFDDTWVRLDCAKDMDYMFNQATVVNANGKTCAIGLCFTVLETIDK
jgi:hypothetical protein